MLRIRIIEIRLRGGLDIGKQNRYSCRVMPYCHPSDWKTVEEADLEEFLKGCPDYTTESHYGSREYRYRHNGELFARIVNGKIQVHSSLLKLA